MAVPKANLLNFAFATFLTAVIGVGGALLIWAVVPKPQPPKLGDYHSPRDILTTVEGVKGPAVKARGVVTMRADRCINRGETTQVEVNQAFISAEGKRVPDLVRAPQNRGQGCTVTDIPVTLPEEVTPGVWHIEGAEGVPETGEIRYWFTSSFTVVP